MFSGSYAPDDCHKRLLLIWCEDLIRVYNPHMAEYGWGLSSELVEKARRELHEEPERTGECMELVREQIVTRPDISRFIHSGL